MPSAKQAVPTDYAAAKAGAIPRSSTQWRHWWMMAVLAGLTILSFIDRNALFVLIDGIKADFNLTDGQSSLLLGAAFAFLYAFAGLPAGYLVDRFDRRLLIVGAVVFWSVMTAFSSLATSFGLLFMGRMGVGLGEAFLSPAAGSLIRNTIPLHKRALAFGILNACSSAGGGLALVIVGGLAATLPATGMVVPMLGELDVWQLVLLCIGAVGLPLALLALTFPEPAREISGQSTQPATLAFFFIWLKRHRGFYLSLYGAMAFTGIGSYGFAAWFPTALARKWSLAPGVVGMTYGTVQIAGALSGILVGAYLIHLLMARRASSVALSVSAVYTLVAAITCILAPMMPSLALSWVLLAVHWFVVPTSGVGAFTSLTAATPNASMGKVMAVGYISHSVAGYGMGPSIVAAVSDHLTPGPLAIGHAIVIVSGIALVIAAFFYHLASRYLAAAQADTDNH